MEQRENSAGRENILLRISPPLEATDLDELFASAWPGYTTRDWTPVLSRSLAYVGAFSAGELVGFVNVAWDGGVHAFLLDTTVHPALQRRGLGSRLVRAATEAARERGAEWLHVDYEPHLDKFYRACGFAPTLAGLIRLDGTWPACGA
jgi:ribosomal protein S18 acetylase RimI-like enzyme